MKVLSNKMKEAVNKAIKGASFNSLIPLTGMIGIKLAEGKLRFITTDMTNALCITVDVAPDEQMDITVDAEKFGKLIAKTTSDYIGLEVKDNVLHVTANGTYKIPLITDEDGLVIFPDVTLPSDDKEFTTVKLTSIMSAYNVNKSALAKTLENPSLTGYYCGENVVTTDANVITFNHVRLFGEHEPLISAQMMYLLTLNNEEDIKCYYDEEAGFTFVTDNVIVKGPELDGKEEFPIEQITPYLDTAFKSKCKLPKDLTIGVLDRLALFIEPYDKNGAYFSFGRTGLTIHSRKDASTELITYVESEGFEAFTCFVDIPMLKEQLQANPEDVITMYYGNENALKIESGNVVQIIALLEDEA